MSRDLAISVRGLSKAYTIPHSHESEVTLAEQALQFIRHPLKKSGAETFWALDDISFDVHKGEVLGVIGRNGAGKSTLLKVLSRITAPTKGELRLFGRVGSLLEVGTGFHPELTGRENIYLNGSILGMRRREIEKQFEAIVEFAGVSRFLDTPVKRYSSGMYVRLAFAVAAHLETEILLVDEVLAVGDAEFQQKCLGAMDEAAGAGKAVLIVSHQIAAIQALAKTALYLQKGMVSAHGSVLQVTQEYVDGLSVTTGSADLSQQKRGEWAQTNAVTLTHATTPPPSSEHDFLDLHITVTNEALTAKSFGLVATFHRLDGIACATAIAEDIAVPTLGQMATTSLRVDTESLVPGRYRILLAAVTFSPAIGHTNHDIVPDALTVEINGPASRHLVAGHAHWPPSWGTQSLSTRTLCRKT